MYVIIKQSFKSYLIIYYYIITDCLILLFTFFSLKHKKEIISFMNKSIKPIKENKILSTGYIILEKTNSTNKPGITTLKSKVNIVI